MSKALTVAGWLIHNSLPTSNSITSDLTRRWREPDSNHRSLSQNQCPKTPPARCTQDQPRCARVKCAGRAAILTIEWFDGDQVMPERFTEILRTTSELGWSQAVQHRFVNELFAGAVPDAVMARYLIQDHRFLDSFLVLLGAALASAGTFAARLRFGRFIGMVSAE